MKGSKPGNHRRTVATVSVLNGTAEAAGVVVALGVILAVLEMQRKNRLGIRVKIDKFY